MRAVSGERQDLERLHSERLAKLRAREEETSEKLKRHQVGAERACRIHVPHAYDVDNEKLRRHQAGLEYPSHLGRESSRGASGYTGRWGYRRW
jgi:oral-facial-digital syndrome 1 protein